MSKFGITQRSDSGARRLVKTWLPPDVVAEMDELIRSSRAYNGRDDFIVEALADRMAEERQHRQALLPRPAVAATSTGVTEKGAAQVGTTLGLWQSQTAPTGPPVKCLGALGGLHNRDYPTLWAADLLASLSAARGEPVSWMHYVPRAASAARDFADQLAALDEDRTLDDMKAAIGFPRNSSKRLASEQRFTEHMLGSIRQGQPAGPLFALGLAGLVDQSSDRVAPTKAGLALLKALAEGGITPRPPHRAECWSLFREHIKTRAQPEYDTWLAVLSQVAEQPSPTQLVAVFKDVWAGAAGQTNVSGYISRSREWGLVAPKLVDGKYRLTDLGGTEVRGGLVR
jgi:Arc/MetJ-type ribon-helix-helix transcriptional regulator